MSLSNKYRLDRQRYEDISDRERSDRQSEYLTDGQSDYRSDNEEQQVPSDITEDTAESEEEHSEHFQHEVEVIFYKVKS